MSSLPPHQFQAMLAYILENVLIHTNVEHTCYFPSFIQLQRVFLLYAGPHNTEMLTQICSTATSQEVQEFMLCYIIMKEYNKQHPLNQLPTAINQIMGMARENLQQIGLMEIQETKGRGGCVIHQGNLINLLNMLATENDNKQTVYYFNEVQADEKSLCFRNLTQVGQ